MNEVSPEELGRDECPRLLKSVVTPRPIAWVSTTSEDGVDNLAPYSEYNYVCSWPPVVMFSATGADDLKDTPRNAIDTGEFVVNLVTEDVVEAMDRTSASLPPDESEFDDAGIERAPSTEVAPPRVADAAVSMECELYDSLRVHRNRMVLGEVRRFHVSETVLDDGRVDMRKIRSVGRLGGPYYTRLDFLDYTREY